MPVAYLDLRSGLTMPIKQPLVSSFAQEAALHASHALAVGQ